MSQTVTHLAPKASVDNLITHLSHFTSLSSLHLNVVCVCVFMYGSEFTRRTYQKHDFSLFNEEIFVYKRPYLDYFVATILEWFEVAIWTASGLLCVFLVFKNCVWRERERERER